MLSDTIYLGLALILLTTTQVLAAAIPSATTCSANSAPNPIASKYPDLITGTLNESVVTVFIDYSIARKIVPKQWGILQVYKKYLPSSSGNLYPVVLELGVDHDVRAGSINVPDFSSVRVTFPFIDLSGDGKSNYRYTPAIFLPPIPLIVAGAEAYGEKAIQSTFDPPCDAYKLVPVGGRTSGQYSFAATSTDNKYNVQLTATVSKATNYFPLDVYKQVLNQPTFGDGLSCDNYTHIFDTSITKPEVIRANLSGRVPNMPSQQYNDAQGIRLDSAFIEGNNVPCDSVRGHYL
ncbi:MAG: hypothetical protein M1812_007819 [Candelaria pacifica]|nr:MAG: hypothetical protein M1812_007819 [Candelaria pacifica]